MKNEKKLEFMTYEQLKNIPWKPSTELSKSVHEDIANEIKTLLEVLNRSEEDNRKHGVTFSRKQPEHKSIKLLKELNCSLDDIFCRDFPESKSPYYDNQ